MEHVSVYDVKTHLSRLLDAVEAGEEVVITRNGHPVARRVRAQPNLRRRLGLRDPLILRRASGHDGRSFRLEIGVFFPT